ncbi:MAG: hypothetical protein GY866_07425, partial [Proteobacteria bacterium]|nr:hypothetical protein [Pseudomonadota bacterium]
MAGHEGRFKRVRTIEQFAKLMQSFLSTEPVVINGNELGDLKSTKEVRKKARKFLKGLREPIINTETGYSIHFSKDGIDKTLNIDSSYRHLTSVVALPEMIQKATFIVESEDEKERPEVKRFLYFHSKVRIAAAFGRVYDVEIAVKELKDGKRFYSHHLFQTGLDRNLVSGAALQEEELGIRPRQTPPSKDSISKPHQDVKNKRQKIGESLSGRFSKAKTIDEFCRIIERSVDKTEPFDRDAEAIEKWMPGAVKAQEKERQRRVEAEAKTDAAVEEISKRQAEWTELEGQLILKIEGQDVAAIPNSGRKNARSFTVFNIDTRKEIVQLGRDEVRSWLYRNMKSKEDETEAEKKTRLDREAEQPKGNITANDLADFAITPIVGPMSHEPEESNVPDDWLVFNKRGYESSQAGHKSWHHGRKGMFTAIDPKAKDAKAKLFVVKRQGYTLVDNFSVDQAREILGKDPEWSEKIDQRDDKEIEGDFLMAKALSYGRFSKLSDADRRRFVSDTKIADNEEQAKEDYSVEYDERKNRYKIGEDGEVLFNAKYNGTWETEEGGKVPKRYLPQLEKAFKRQNLIDDSIPERLWTEVQYWVNNIESSNSGIGIGVRNGDSPYMAFRKSGMFTSAKGIDTAHRFKHDLDTLTEIARFNWRDGDKKDEYKSLDGRGLNSLWKKLTGEKAKGIGQSDIEALGNEADDILDGKRKFSGTGWTAESLFTHLYNRLKGIGESLTTRKRQAKRHVKGRVTKKKKSGHRLQGRIRVYGLDIAVENKKGSRRKGKDPNKEPWETTMKWPYGYIRASLGKDADAVDCFVGPDRKAQLVYVIAQHQVEKTEKWKNGRDSRGRLPKDSPEAYDEDKAMLCFKSRKEAIKAYRMHYDRPDLFLGPVSTYTVKDFKKVLKKSFGKKIPMKIGEESEVLPDRI